MNKVTIGIILLDMVILGGAGLIYFKVKNKNKPKDPRSFDIFYFEGEDFCLNSPVRKWSCKKDDIDYIKFSCKKARLGNYRGFGEIFRKDTDVVQKIMFDGSVYSKKVKLITSEKDIRNAIEFCIDTLTKNNIRCEYED